MTKVRLPASLSTLHPESRSLTTQESFSKHLCPLMRLPQAALLMMHHLLRPMEARSPQPELQPIRILLCLPPSSTF
jgi:hypothetical protein